ncbi:MAG: glucose-1-phosphate thymidylyltransferase [Lentisphaerae bacterium]|nr:MAG: glucose-1-phosphate thymidylyltransferase [Lentisphaerota bacterium]
MAMKGIVLAGGAGTRLYPLSVVASKQLLPVYDKPMIYYPLATLMLAGIKDILIISTPHDIPRFQNLLKDGSQWGINLQYCIQERPEGIAQAFILGEEFIGQDNVTLILGDNIFYGRMGLDRIVSEFKEGATVFGYYVNDPERYGVIDFDASGNIKAILEKPANPPSNYAVTGLYIYDNTVSSVARRLRPSARGELEITDLNMEYLKAGKLNVEILGRGVAWLDTGTPKSLLEAANFIEAIQNRQGLRVACLEEIACEKGYLSWAQLEEQIVQIPPCPYREYLQRQIREHLK